MRQIEFLKIRFIDVYVSEVEEILDKGGLLLFPSGPGLSNLSIGTAYYNSLCKADYNFFDSGYFVLLLRIFKKIKVKKFSGYRFISCLLNLIKLKKINNLFLVEPNLEVASKNKIYLSKLNNFYIRQYIAPYYEISKIYDKKLMVLLNSEKPKFILINIGGGVQEILGSYLKEKLKYNPTIICTGAALSFFTGNQAPIGNYMDKFFLGWLVRILFNPKIFFNRYFKTFKFIKIFFRYKNTTKII